MSWSVTFQDCSWFFACDLDNLKTHVGGFLSDRFDGSPGANLTRGEAEAYRCHSPGRLPHPKAADRRAADGAEATNNTLAMARIGLALARRVTTPAAPDKLQRWCRPAAAGVRSALPRGEPKPAAARSWSEALPTESNLRLAELLGSGGGCVPRRPEHGSFEQSPWGPLLRRVLAPWSGGGGGGGAPRQSLHDAVGAYHARANWCRLMTCIVNGSLWVRADRHDASRLIMAYRTSSFLLGLATLLQRHPALPDVCLVHSCMDVPSVPAAHDAPPVLGYTSADGFADVPWPDYLHWGRPESLVSPWDLARRDILGHAAALPFEERLNRAIYDASAPSRLPEKPLRVAFEKRCLAECGAEHHAAAAVRPAANVSRARRSGREGGATDVELRWAEVERQFQLAARLSSNVSDVAGQGSWQFRYKCHYKAILALQGTSVWLDRWPQILSCGSAVILAADWTNTTRNGTAPLHSLRSFFSPLLEPNRDYLHVDLHRRAPEQM